MTNTTRRFAVIRSPGHHEFKDAVLAVATYSSASSAHRAAVARNADVGERRYRAVTFTSCRMYGFRPIWSPVEADALSDAEDDSISVEPTSDNNQPTR